MEEPNKYCFTSDLFEIEEREDEDTNPGMYGKSLAKWLSEKFKDLGYVGTEYDAEEDIVPSYPTKLSEHETE